MRVHACVVGGRGGGDIGGGGAPAYEHCLDVCLKLCRCLLLPSHLRLSCHHATCLLLLVESTISEAHLMRQNPHKPAHYFINQTLDSESQHQGKRSTIRDTISFSQAAFSCEAEQWQTQVQTPTLQQQ